MRPETANRIVRRQIQSYLYNGVAFDKKLMTIALNKRIEKVVRDLNRIEREWGIKQHVYDKGTCLKNLVLVDEELNTLMYYSDRFNAPHRLWWLKEMIEQEIYKVK